MTDVDGMDDIVRDFVLESYEGLEQFERDLIALEQDPGSPELLSQIFRIVHTVKGTCSFLPFRTLESVAHAGESLLTRLRQGEVEVTSDVTDSLLALADAIRAMLGHIETTGAESGESFMELIGRLQGLQATEPTPQGTDTTSQVANEPAQPPTVLRAVPDTGESTDAAPEAAAAEEARPALGDAKIRVDVALLDTMMNLVGELVLARNQLSQRATGGTDVDLRHLSQRLRMITTDLQEGVMQARMQPIDTVWNKLPRLVRDLSTQLGKPVRLDVTGSETELDRTILEAIKDPMTHIVRNAIDHGIEPADQRIAAGKPATATLSLRAFHQGGLVNIEITDDGAGMDPDVLRQVAVSRGVVSAEHASRLGDKESLDLIFRPGFSTAAQVSNVSGRGVGMDVVKTNVERIGGVVEVHSALGQGTTFKVRIPLTLAIIPALVIRSHGQRYAIPQPHVQELVQLGAGSARIEYAHDAPVYRLRGELLPLVNLREQLQVERGDDKAGTVVVLQNGTRSVGMVVDAVVGTEEVVVKPLGKQLRDLPLYAGATTMGDGGLALILDVAALAARAGVRTDETDGDRSATAGEKTSVDDAATGPETVQLLLVGLPGAARVAMPLSAVRRLERIPVASVDRVDDAYVVNYRDGLLPLVYAGPALAAAAAEAATEAGDPTLTVVVCRLEGVTVGLVVSEIVDIVDGELLSTAGTSEGTQRLAPVLVDDHLTSLLDLDDLLLEVHADLLRLTTTAEALR